jgi:hypothetical protein
MRYKLHSAADQDFVIDLDRNAFIPFDPANTDYAKYLEWLAEGNEPLPVDAPQVQSLESPVPSTDASVDAE